MKISITENLSKLPLPATSKWPDGVWDIEAFKHNDMSLVFFSPELHDYQTSHPQDELYMIIEGSGTLEVENEAYDCVSGDVFFVKANQRHRFSKIKDGLKMWAILWGDITDQPNS